MFCCWCVVSVAVVVGLLGGVGLVRIVDIVGVSTLIISKNNYDMGISDVLSDFIGVEL